MKTKKRSLVLGAALAIILLGLQTAGTQAQKGVDYEAIAQKMVNQCTAVKEGDLVLVYGRARDLELLENIVVNVRKVGAFPFLAIGSDRMTRREYTEVPAKYDTQTPEFELKLAGMVGAIISVEYSENEGLLSDIPAQRLAAADQAYAPVNDLLNKRSVRRVSLGNALYPTDELAKRFGLPKEELSRIFWEGVNVDYAKLQEACESVKAVLAGGKDVHITNPNGTDLKVRIEGRPAFVSDGVISADDQKKGGAACIVYLPAGEAYITPVPATAEGKVVIDRSFYAGKEIEGLTMIFKAGKLVSMTAKSGLEGLKALYDASGAGKEDFAFIDIGLNPNVRAIPGSRLTNYVCNGMVTLGIGNNVWAGGTNAVSFSYDGFLPGSTLTIDGKTIVENGSLKH